MVMLYLRVNGVLLYYSTVLLSFSSTQDPPELTTLDYDDLDALVTHRPSPFNFEKIHTNKSEDDIHMEDCMKEFYTCKSFLKRDIPICAERDKQTKFFNNYCEMLYENCKDEKNSWHYLDDRIC